MYSIVFVAILYTVADKFHDQNINVAALIFTETKTVQEEILHKMGRASPSGTASVPIPIILRTFFFVP